MQASSAMSLRRVCTNARTSRATVRWSAKTSRSWRSPCKRDRCSVWSPTSDASESRSVPDADSHSARCFSSVIEVPHEERAETVEGLVQRLDQRPMVATASEHRDRVSLELVGERLDLRVVTEDREPNIVQGRRSLLSVHLGFFPCFHARPPSRCEHPAAIVDMTAVGQQWCRHARQAPDVVSPSRGAAFRRAARSARGQRFGAL